MISTKFQDFDQILEFQANFRILTKFQNFRIFAKFQDVDQTLPEAQRTQGIESIT